jgi:hypothetical protein
MMAKLSDLVKQMEELEVSLPALMAKAKAAVGRAMVNSLIENTPVDTSQALSNWKVAWGNPDRQVIAPYFRGIYGTTFIESGLEAKSQAAEVLGFPQENKSLFLSNNVDYIEQLDAGTISEQDGLFVEAAYLIAGEIIDGYQLKLPASL